MPPSLPRRHRRMQAKRAALFDQSTAPSFLGTNSYSAIGPKRRSQLLPAPRNEGSGTGLRFLWARPPILGTATCASRRRISDGRTPNDLKRDGWLLWRSARSFFFDRNGRITDGRLKVAG